MVNLMRLLSDVGINNAAVQRKDLDDEALHTAFTMKLLFGIVMFILIVSLSGFSIYFFNDSKVVNVIRLLALTIVINTFAFMPCIMLSRKLRFKDIAITDTINTISNSAIAVTMAINGFKYWSIAVGFVASNAIFAVAVNYCLKCKIYFAMNKRVAIDLFGYGSKVLVTSMLSFAILNFDNFIVGTAGGASLLGYYGLAFNWGSMVCSIMSAVVLSVLFPTFARMQDDKGKMKHAYLDVLQYTAIFSVLWNLALFCVADRFLVHVLGKGTDKWLPALDSLRIFCIYGIVRSFIEPTNMLLMASGNARLVMKSGVLVALIEFALVYPAIRFGSIKIVSIIVLFAFVSQVFLLRKNIAQTYGITIKEVASIILPVVCVALTVGLIYFIGNSMLGDNLPGLILAVTLVCCLYLIVFGWITKWQHYSRIYRLVRR